MDCADSKDGYIRVPFIVSQGDNGQSVYRSLFKIKCSCSSSLNASWYKYLGSLSEDEAKAKHDALIKLRNECFN